MGSSAISRRGPQASALAIATRCFSPTLSSRGRWFSLSLSPASLRARRALSGASRPLIPFKLSISSTFWMAVRPPSKLNCWKMNPISVSRRLDSCESLACEISFSFKKILPLSGRNNDPHISKSVVLPLPLGPMRRTSCPSSTLSDTSLMA